MGDKLPTVYDAVLAISARAYARNKKVYKKFVTTVHNYAVALRKMWVKSFTENHVIAKSTIMAYLEDHTKNFQDYTQGWRKYGMNKKDRPPIPPTAVRRLNKEWRLSKVSGCTNNISLAHPPSFFQSWCGWGKGFP